MLSETAVHDVSEGMLSYPGINLLENQGNTAFRLIYRSATTSFYFRKRVATPKGCLQYIFSWES